MFKVHAVVKRFKSSLACLRKHLFRQQRCSQSVARPQAPKSERRFLGLSPDILNQRVPGESSVCYSMKTSSKVAHFFESAHVIKKAASAVVKGMESENQTACI